MSLPTPDKKAARYRPNFTNPVPLPAIDDFKLNRILAKQLREQSEAVELSLCNVNSKYQHDLRQQIRKTLTIEQKIQYKNISVAKLAHGLHKKLNLRKSKPDRALSRESGIAGIIPLESDVGRLLELSVRNSAAIKNISFRLARIDRNRGGNGPDAIKFPKLAKFLARTDEAVELNGMRVDATALVDIDLDSESEEPHPVEDYIEGSQRQKSVQIDENDAVIERNGPIEGTEMSTTTSSPDISIGNGKIVQNGQRTDEACDESDDMSPESFELLMDMNISKYREAQKGKFAEDIFEHAVVDTAARKGNPLRLLYSSSALAHSDMLKSKLAEDQELKCLFVTAKSIPTVLLTPQLSHYKKLRINALPMSFSVDKKPNCACSEQDSPAKIALAVTLLKDKPSEDELWSSSGLHTETENDSEPLNWSSSSDPDSSSDEDDTSHATNNYYLSFKNELRSKKKRKKKVKTPFLKASSPTPKHKPSHRTLKPKRSILKITKPGPKKVGTVLPIPDNLESPYRASPRASFVSDVAAKGYILKSRHLEDEDSSEDGDLEDNYDALPPLEADSSTIDKLKKLLI